MANFRIPKQFKLYGRTIKVVFVSKMIHDRDAVGLAVYRENKIKLQKSTTSRPILCAQLEQAFCHEMSHFIFECVGTPKTPAPNDDEDYVDAVASLLHQALTTMEY